VRFFSGKGEEEPRGRRGEKLAARFLKRQGYRILRRNCRNKYGEIDLVARDGNEVVFVEVKTRVSGDWGDPAKAVNRPKQRRLRLAAERFATRAEIRDFPLRFDIVAIVLPDDGAPDIRHYRNAFRMPGRGIA